MSAVDSYHTLVFGESCSVDPGATTPVGPLATAVAATLIIGTTHTFAGHDFWSFDHYIVPGPHEALGTGDEIMVYRHMFNSFVHPLPVPIFSAVLSHVVAWGNENVEFSLKDLITGEHRSRSISLPLNIVRLSFLQHLRRWVCPLPRSSTRPLPIKQYAPPSKPLAGTRPIGDRVPRDSDDLPIWNARRVPYLGRY